MSRNQFRVGQLVRPKNLKSGVHAEIISNNEILFRFKSRGFVEQDDLVEMLANGNDLYRIEETSLSSDVCGLLLGEFFICYDNNKKDDYSIVLFGKVIYVVKTDKLEAVTDE